MILHSIFRIALGILLFTVTACGSAPRKEAVDPVYKTEEFSAPLATELSVDVGDSILTKGQAAYVEIYTLSGPIKSTMPGAYGVPFAFQIGQTALTKRYRRGHYEYFCAPLEEAGASFPGLGQVVRSGDCIGVRRSISDGSIEWVVDNSNHNGYTTVWSRDYKPEKDPELTQSTGELSAKGSRITMIRFDGFYSNLLHFTLIEHDRSGKTETEFKFDYPPRTGDPVYGIKGNLFQVNNVSNADLEYEWEELSDS